MRGISVKTTVVITIAVIVLYALLNLFSSGPGPERAKLEQQKADLCTTYVSADANCRAAPSSDLQNVCDKLGTSTIRACCIAYCPKVETVQQCTSVGGTCNSKPCSEAKQNEIGRCSDNPGTPLCCA